MAKSQQSFNKKEREKQKSKKRVDKLKKKAERREQGTSSFDDMIAYVDINGNITSSPVTHEAGDKIAAEDIELDIAARNQRDKPDPYRTGIITYLDSSKGYGFIKDLESQDSVFTHINGHLERLSERDKVQFKVERGPKGLSATEVKKWVKPQE